MNGNNKFGKVVLFLALFMSCIGALAFTYIVAEGPITNAQDNQAAVSIAAQPETEMERAWDRTRDMVIAGFASNTAIAASGDAAQASMARSFTSALWALAIMFVSVAVALIVTSNKPSKEKHTFSKMFLPDQNSEPMENKARKN